MSKHKQTSHHPSKCSVSCMDMSSARAGVGVGVSNLHCCHRRGNLPPALHRAGWPRGRKVRSGTSSSWRSLPSPSLAHRLHETRPESSGSDPPRSYYTCTQTRTTVLELVSFGNDSGQDRVSFFQL